MIHSSVQFSCSVMYGCESWTIKKAECWRIDAFELWCTLWKRPWCWERLKVGGEGNDRGWDGWMASWARKIPWRRKWQSTPALLLGKSHGGRRLIGYSPWGQKELDTTERFHFQPLSYRAPLLELWNQKIHLFLAPSHKADIRQIRNWKSLWRDSYPSSCHHSIFRKRKLFGDGFRHLTYT